MPAASERMSAWIIGYAEAMLGWSAIRCGKGPTKFGEVWEGFASVGEVDEVGGCCGSHKKDRKIRTRASRLHVHVISSAFLRSKDLPDNRSESKECRPPVDLHIFRGLKATGIEA